jgi:hypothetical protein
VSRASDGLRGQARLLQSLVLWMRRRHDVPPGATALPYGREGRVLGLALLAASVIEVVAVELVVPWPGVRLVLLVLGLYGVLAVLGWVADLSVRPHVLTAESLRLRLGSATEVDVPLAAVERVSRRLRGAEGTVTLADGTLVLAVGNQTQIEVRLTEPLEVTVGRRAGTVQVVRFSVDDPAAALRMLQDAAAQTGRGADPRCNRSREPGV